MWIFFIAVELFVYILTGLILFMNKKKKFYIINFSLSIGLILISVIRLLFLKLDYTAKQLVLIHIVFTAVCIFILALLMLIDFICYKKTPHVELNGNNESIIQTNPAGSSYNIRKNINTSTEPSISFDEMKRKFFVHWSIQIQSTPDQRKRFNRAKHDTIYNLLNINPDNGTAQCYSSSYDVTGVKYDVTYHSCTCPDYQKRFYPCKHIYALVINLGIMKDDADLSGIPSNVREKIELLPPESLRSFKSILTQNKNYTPFLMKTTPRNKPLLALGLIEDTENIPTLINLLFTRNDLVAKIYESNLDYKPNSKTTKEEIIRQITESNKDFVKKIIKNNVLVTLSREVVMNYKCIYSYYFESEENNCY